MNLKELRTQGHLTQQKASEITGLPLRTYIRYENDETKSETIKYIYAAEKLAEYNRIDETKGILSIEKIKEIISPILAENDIELCILFGSYARGSATEKSDIDLLIKTKLKGLSFYGLFDQIKEALHKKIDLLRIEDLKDNSELLSEILRYGVRIYG